VKVDDHMMTVLTGLVVAVVVGTLLQETSAISRFFGGAPAVEANNDVLFVRSDGTQTLDVTSNDTGISEGMNLRVLKEPTCGTVAADGLSLSYTPGASCDGTFRLTYCVLNGDECPSARVTFTVHDSYAEGTSEQVTTVVAASQADAGDDGSVSALVATMDAPEPTDERASDPYLAAIASIVDWKPGDLALPDTPGALLLGGQVAEPDPTASSKYLWSPKSKVEAAEKKAGLAPPQGADEQPIITGLAAVLVAPDTRNLPLSNTPQTPEAVLPSLTSNGDLGAAQPIDGQLTATSDTAQETCPVDMSVEPRPGARLDIVLSGGCLSGEELLLSHGGVQFAIRMTSTGKQSISIPALAQFDDVELTTMDGTLLGRQPAQPEDFDELHRFAVVLEKASQSTLIATERTRTTGLVREVTLRNFITHQDAVGLGRGYIRAYEAAKGQRIEVYTLPVSERTTLPDVTLKIRRKNDDFCGEPLEAKIAEAGTLLMQVVQMPECGNVQIADVGAIVQTQNR